MKQFKIKNYLIYPNDQVKILPVFLNEMMLHGKESRARTKFVKILVDKIAEINAEKEKMILTYCKKNDKKEPLFLYTEITEKDGKPVPVEKETTERAKGQRYAFETKEDETKFETEWKDFINEDFIIDILPSNSEIINTVAKLVFETTSQFSGNDAALYNEWCESFDSIEEVKVKVKK